MSILVKMRLTSNFLLVIGHIILLNFNPITGILIKFLAFMLGLPFFIKTRMWDVVTLSIVFSTIEISKLVSVLNQ